MAKPNDTRIAPASTNSHPSTTPLPPELVALLQSLLARQASIEAAPKPPKPPKHCCPARIRPRRRVTVGAGAAPASNPAVPRIHLSGHWLALAGFGVHTRVRIHVAHEIVILIPEADQLKPQ